jgi:hypothetical protein
MIRALHFVSFHPTMLRSRWDVRTLVSQEITQRHLLGLLLGSYMKRSASGQSALVAPALRQNPIIAARNPQTPCPVYSRELSTYPCLRFFGSRAVRAWLEEAGRSLPVGCVLIKEERGLWRSSVSCRVRGSIRLRDVPPNIFAATKSSGCTRAHLEELG